MSGAIPFISPLAAVILGKKKSTPAPTPAPTVQQRVNTTAADVLSARRGSRANQRTGRGGAELQGGVKSKMGQ